MLQQHLEDTYQYLFDAAHEALKAGPSFVPFGAGIRKTGEQIHSTVDLDWQSSTPQDHISGLIAGFRHDDAANGLMAAGLVFDGQVRAGDGEGRALCFHLEAANGRALEVLVPYERAPGDVLAFGEPDTAEVAPEIFPPLEG